MLKQASLEQRLYMLPMMAVPEVPPFDTKQQRDSDWLVTASAIGTPTSISTS
jgi:hypothetical protein